MITFWFNEEKILNASILQHSSFIFDSLCMLPCLYAFSCAIRSTYFLHCTMAILSELLHLMVVLAIDYFSLPCSKIAQLSKKHVHYYCIDLPYVLCLCMMHYYYIDLSRTARNCKNQEIYNFHEMHTQLKVTYAQLEYSFNSLSCSTQISFSGMLLNFGANANLFSTFFEIKLAKKDPLKAKE